MLPIYEIVQWLIDFDNDFSNEENPHICEVSKYQAIYLLP